MDKRSFSIIIILVTVISYLFIRKYFKIAPRYLFYGIIGILVGLTIGVAIAWPMAEFLGNFGVVVAPYVLGVILMIFIEIFIIEGSNIIVSVTNRLKGRKASMDEMRRAANTMNRRIDNTVDSLLND